jgi:hypothetical protein
MDKKLWNKILKENTLTEKKNDFVATGEKVLISIHNSPDVEMNERLYNDLVDFIKRLSGNTITKPKKIDITF